MLPPNVLLKYGRKHTRRKIAKFIADWEKRGYPDGIPDQADPKLESYGLVPSYRRICLAILKNDHALVSLGYTRPQTDAYCMLKRIEINARNERLRSRKM